MWNARLDEAQAGIKIAGRSINNLRYADDTTFMAESEEELKSLLIKVKEENEKAGLKLNIQKTQIMASSPITYGKWMGKQWKQWETFFSWAPKSLQMVIAVIKDACSDATEWLNWTEGWHMRPLPEKNSIAFSFCDPSCGQQMESFPPSPQQTCQAENPLIKSCEVQDCSHHQTPELKKDEGWLLPSKI